MYPINNADEPWLELPGWRGARDTCRHPAVTPGQAVSKETSALLLHTDFLPFFFFLVYQLTLKVNSDYKYLFCL